MKRAAALLFALLAWSGEALADPEEAAAPRAAEEPRALPDFRLERFRNGQGAGFRVAWNQATIIVVDYGVSREGSSLYVNFNQPF